jgi:hypothetical protein
MYTNLSTVSGLLHALAGCFADALYLFVVLSKSSWSPGLADWGSGLFALCCSYAYILPLHLHPQGPRG